MKTLTRVWCPSVLALALWLSNGFAQEATSDTLLSAQRRVSAAMKGLGKAKADLKRQEARVADAEAALTRSQQKVEEDKAKLEQARKNLEEARGSAEAAQRDYDQASAEIQRLYRERQPASNPKP